MQEASDATVLGDFDDAVATHYSSRARFFRKGGRFLVETEGKDGKTSEFQVKYTFGIDPLQQYLVEFPDGRIQALPYAWDTRSKDKGGQRWFHLYPGEDIPPADPLHWTGPQQNWNYMCSECHSTNVRKNYDAAKDSFQTTFSETGVGCEACHGPASGHIAWATGGQAPTVAHHGFLSVAASRGPVAWTSGRNTGSPTVSAPQPPGGEVETCERCHARRGQFSEDWRPGQPLADTHLPVFLTGDLFEDDGQMKDEVFNSPFRQSKMFAKGVVCTDCHDPHGGKLKAPGSEVCSQCHSPGKFATVGHTGHAPGPGAPDCVACHMPVRTYMVVDPRHDHSFRIPRPDLTVKTGTPNTCTSCHADHDAAWAAAAAERWHGPGHKGFQTYTEAFHAARLDDPSARERLLQVARDPSVPAIAKATALLELRKRTPAGEETWIGSNLQDPDPMVRIAALRGVETLPAGERWRLGKAALSDPVRAVRMEAASRLAGVPVFGLDDADRAALGRASHEYIDSRQFNADHAEERTNLAGFYARQGKAGLAGQEYLAAMKLAPGLVPPRVDLADLYRAQGREAEAESLLRETIALAPAAAAPHHALGLSLVRQKRYGEAIEELKRAAELEPAQARYAYVYGVALQSAGELAKARQVLEQALSKSPSNTDILAGLLRDAMEAREFEKALPYAERLSALIPSDTALARLASQLKQAVKR
ncbi:MAG: tetratricopeptide repeat protein [Rhodomicrobium sp.]